MTGLVDAAGAPIAAEIKGREIWRVQRPPRPGFRPEVWKLLELENGRFQFVTERRGRNEAVGPEVGFEDAGQAAQAYAAGGLAPTPGLVSGLATALCAMAALAGAPDPEDGGEAAEVNERDAA